MKKLAKIIVPLVLITSLVSMTAAYGEVETDMWWGDNRSTATELFPGVLYRVHGVSSLFSGGWYYIRPTSVHESCYIYNRAVEDGWYYIQVYDAVGNKIDASSGYGVNDEGLFEFDVQANDVVYVRFISDTLVASEPLVTICFPDTRDFTGSSERILSEPTCTQVGYKGISCSLCHVDNVTAEIPMVAHSPSEWTVVTPATCTSAGLRQQFCTSCGTVLQEANDPPLGHNYTDWEVLVEATKQEEGEKYRYCLNCGDEQYESIPKKPKFLGIF